MGSVIAYGLFAGFIFWTVRLGVRGVRRGNREGWHFRAPWVRRLHGDLDA